MMMPPFMAATRAGSSTKPLSQPIIFMNNDTLHEQFAEWLSQHLDRVVKNHAKGELTKIIQVYKQKKNQVAPLSTGLHMMSLFLHSQSRRHVKEKYFFCHTSLKHEKPDHVCSWSWTLLGAIYKLAKMRIPITVAPAFQLANSIIFEGSPVHIRQINCIVKEKHTTW